MHVTIFHVGNTKGILPTPLQATTRQAGTINTAFYNQGH